MCRPLAAGVWVVISCICPALEAYKTWSTLRAELQSLRTASGVAAAAGNNMSDSLPGSDPTDHESAITPCGNTNSGSARLVTEIELYTPQADLESLVAFIAEAADKNPKYHTKFTTIMQACEAEAAGVHFTPFFLDEKMALHAAVAFLDAAVAQHMPDNWFEMSVRVKVLEVRTGATPCQVFESVAKVDSFLTLRATYFAMCFASLLSDGPWDSESGKELYFPTKNLVRALKDQAVIKGLMDLHMR